LASRKFLTGEPIATNEGHNRASARKSISCMSLKPLATARASITNPDGSSVRTPALFSRGSRVSDVKGGQV
jgi:hypothetical protein